MYNLYLDGTRKLWTINNHKTVKGLKLGYNTLLLHLAPHNIAFNPAKYDPKYSDLPIIKGSDLDSDYFPPEIIKGSTLCAHSTPECRKLCLFTSGNGTYPSVERGRIQKTQAFLLYPMPFMRALITQAVKGCIKSIREGYEPVFRPNGTQDLPIESMILHDIDPIIIKGFKPFNVNGFTLLQVLERIPKHFDLGIKKLVVYDYSKYMNRGAYDITYSYTGSPASLRNAKRVLQAGGKVAFVYNGDMPSTFHGFPTVNGDKHDLTFVHGKGVALALKGKGVARGKVNKFIMS